MEIREFINRLKSNDKTPFLFSADSSEKIDYYHLSELVLRYTTENPIPPQTLCVIESGAGETSIVEFLSILYSGAIPLILNTRLSHTEKAMVIHQYHNKPTNEFPVLDNYLTQTPNDSCFILLTSGSNSAPKPVVHSFNRAIAAAKRSTSFLNLTSNDIWFQSLSLAHIGGLMITLRALVSGSSVVLSNTTHVAQVVQIIEKYNVTHLSLVPAQLYDWIESDVQLPASIKVILLGGAKARKHTLKNALKKGYPLYGVYGSTETLAFATIYSLQEFPDVEDGAGFALSGVSLKIRNEDGEIVESGSGEIMVGSNTTLIDYLDYPSQFIDGFFSTGDIGVLDTNGFLSKVSRKDDTIISGGENIQPKEIEALLVDFLTREYCVIGIEHPKWGEEVVLIVEGTAHTTIEHVRVFLSNRIANFKIPKRILTVEKLPRTAKGEIDKKSLKVMIKT